MHALLVSPTYRIEALCLVAVQHDVADQVHWALAYNQACKHDINIKAGKQKNNHHAQPRLQRLFPSTLCPTSTLALPFLLAISIRTFGQGEDNRTREGQLDLVLVRLLTMAVSARWKGRERARFE